MKENENDSAQNRSLATGENSKHLTKSVIEDLVGLFMSDVRPSVPIQTHLEKNTAEDSLVMWALFLIAHKKGSIREIDNYDGPEAIVTIDRQYISNLSEPMLNDWVEKGIQTKSLVMTDEALSPIIEKYRPKFITGHYIFEAFDKLNGFQLENTDYLALLDTAIEQAADDFSEYLPFYSKELAALSQYLLGPECGNVLDPFAGVLRGETIPDGMQLTGLIADYQICELENLRNILTDAASKVKVENKAYNEWGVKQYDAVSTMPPYESLQTGTYREPVEWLMDRFDTSDAIRRKMVLITSMGVLISFRPQTRDLRQRLVEHNYIDTIIILPSLIGYSSRVVMLLNKEKITEEVTLVDATSMTVEEGRFDTRLDCKTLYAVLAAKEDQRKIKVSLDELSRNEYSLLFSDYLRQPEEEIPEGYTKQFLSDILQLPVLRNVEGDENVKVIQNADLSNNPYEDAIDSSKLITLKELKEIRRTPIISVRYRMAITEPALLICRFGRLKMAYCEASSETPVVVPNEFMAFRVCGDINIKYLKKEIFRLRDFLLQGRPMPKMTQKRLLGAFIAVAPRASQDVIVRDAENAYLLSQMKVNKMEKVFEKMIADRNAQMEEIASSIRHDLRNSLSKIVHSVVNMRLKNIPEIEGNLDRIAAAVSYISELIQFYGKLDDMGEPVTIDVIAVMKNELFPMFDNSPIYQLVSQIPSGEKAFVTIPPIGFKRVIENIVRNAEKHGFKGEPSPTNRVSISMKVENGERVVIEIANNGVPMPKEIKKTEYGMVRNAAGPTKGDGIGGGTVRRIVEQAGGDFEIESNEERTAVTLFLPIEKNYTEDEVQDSMD